jgi:hypothetical protein
MDIWPDEMKTAPKWKQNLFKFGVIMGTGFIGYTLIEWAVGM